MKTDIHDKDFALRLVLKERPRELGNGLFFCRVNGPYVRLDGVIYFGDYKVLVTAQFLLSSIATVTRRTDHGCLH